MCRQGKNKTNLLSDISEDKKLETNHQVKITNNRRLSPKSVKELEDKLECEYMPFYFHDVRTNEVLPFHYYSAELVLGDGNLLTIPNAFILENGQIEWEINLSGTKYYKTQQLSESA